MSIPKIVLDETRKRGMRRVAAFLGTYEGSDIYSLGVDSKENWIPCPPNPIVIVAVKDGKLTVLSLSEAARLAFSLCEK